MRDVYLDIKKISDEQINFIYKSYFQYDISNKEDLFLVNRNNYITLLSYQVGDFLYVVNKRYIKNKKEITFDEFIEIFIY